jgi:hypothetical protein
MLIRWYKANLDSASLRALTDSMLRDAFTQKAECGFKIEERRRSHVRGAFYEKLVHIDAVVDPFGSTEEYKRVEYRTTEFVIRSTAPTIEIYGGGRGTGVLFSRLLEYLGPQAIIAPLNVAVSEWLATLEALTSAEVLGIEFADIALSASAKSSLRVDGVSDVRGSANKLIGRRSHRVTKATVRWRSDNQELLCEIRDSARAKVLRGSQDVCMRALLGSLVAAAQRTTGVRPT